MNGVSRRTIVRGAAWAAPALAVAAATPAFAASPPPEDPTQVAFCLHPSYATVLGGATGGGTAAADGKSETLSLDSPRISLSNLRDSYPTIAYYSMSIPTNDPAQNNGFTQYWYNYGGPPGGMSNQGGNGSVAGGYFGSSFLQSSTITTDATQVDDSASPQQPAWQLTPITAPFQLHVDAAQTDPGSANGWLWQTGQLGVYHPNVVFNLSNPQGIFRFYDENGLDVRLTGLGISNVCRLSISEIYVPGSQSRSLSLTCCDNTTETIAY